ncbi:MAG: dihydroorotase [Flavobacteriales bacterium]|nr:dihydroorotase [Flavobacteriales bacterium]|tara:strand:- start:1721 stop:3070 length:1350 start_codon:yes stop_codon:yes gene_type:complete
METLYIKNATIVNEGKEFIGNVIVEDGKIKDVIKGDYNFSDENAEIFDASGLHLLPGMIDDQVHFREPGLTHKANIRSESRAAVAGGITSFMEMPNTNPQTTTHSALENKFDIAAKDALANHSFFFGATNENIDEVLAVDSRNVCGIKIFMGSSTGNMLVDNRDTLRSIFGKCDLLIATHCEDEATVRRNEAIYKAQFGEELPIEYHPVIRDAEACYKSSSMAVELAKELDARLHVLHISTAKETVLFRNDIPLKDKRITAEACVHHLWFTDEDYKEKGTRIKWNPAVKSSADRAGVMEAILDDRIDIIATDHAPHTMDEKNNLYFSAPSGGPLVQHAMVSVLELVRQGKIPLSKAVQKMCHAPAELFQIPNRGYIKKGFQADLVLVNLNNPWIVSKSNILYKCGWSPFEGQEFSAQIKATFVNGIKVYEDGQIIEPTSNPAQKLIFSR